MREYTDQELGIVHWKGAKLTLFWLGAFAFCVGFFWGIWSRVLS